MIERVKYLTNKISASILGNPFYFRVEYDNEFGEGRNRRVFLQVVYWAPCTKDGESKEWYGRKWYLSKHMTTDEIFKTAYVAFESAVKHEVMEGFKIDGKILFNPHVNFEELLAVSEKEVSR